MSPDEEMFWDHRFETIESSARSGYFVKGDRALRLPVLLDLVNSNGPRAEGGSSDPSWEGIEVSVERSSGEVHPLAAEMLKEALRGIGIKDMGGAVGFWKREVSCILDGLRMVFSILDIPLSRALEQDPGRTATLLGRIAGEEPGHPPIYMPGVADGKNIELLLYMGAEVLDTTRAYMDGLCGIYYSSVGTLSWEKDGRDILGQTLCDCSACRALEEGKRKDVNILLGDHNRNVLHRRLALARVHLERGTLRQHVSGSVCGSPRHATMFRIFEENNIDLFEENAPTWRKRGMPLLSYREDLRSGEFSYWEKRMIDDYRPPDWKDVLLLLPCSARKPYSLSRTHMRIADGLRDIKGWKDRVHRVVMTSPLGAVPMELEELYPAAHYDLPVTGRWYPEELERTRRVVRSLIGKGSYEHVICYHGDGSLFFGGELDGDKLYGVPFVDVHSMEKDPMSSLKEVLNELLEKPSSKGKLRGNSELAEQLCTVRFSLGVDLSDQKGLRYYRSRRGREIKRGSAPFMDLRTGGPVPGPIASGLIWERLEEENRGKRVRIDEFVPKGTIFNQGIESAKGDVHPGDIVFISSESGYRGVGRALVPGSVMNTSMKGPSIKMISHVKAH